MVCFLWKQRCRLNIYWADLSSSPPGPYQQDAYLIRPEDKLKHPPVLPPHLLQVLLNKDTGISVSSSVVCKNPGRILSTPIKRPSVCFVISVTQRCSQNRTTWCSITCTPSPSRWETTPAFILKISHQHPVLCHFLLFFLFIFSLEFSNHINFCSSEIF